MINKYSKTITQNVRNGAAQSMLYALGMTKKDLFKAQIGVGTVSFESNPCNAKLDKLSKVVANSLKGDKYYPFKFSSIGVSDGITMGTKGMCYSLPSRELIANNFETITKAHYYDGLVCIPGCDKNLPGVLMAMCRIDRPSFIIYGGSMPPSNVNGKETDIVTAFECYGEMISGKISKKEHDNIIQNCCNKIGGSCSGLYTANTMASLFEVMGLTLPNSSSNPAYSNEKYKECSKSREIMDICMEKDLKPSTILNKKSFINAIKMLYCIGGSTNAIIHLLAIANELNINLDISEFNNYSDTPILLNMKPHGENMMYHLHKNGGMSIFINYLIGCGIINGNQMTITGKTLHENVTRYSLKHFRIHDMYDLTNFIKGQNVIMNINKPFKESNHIHILKGNIAKNGCISKIYDINKSFKGEVLVYECENDMISALNNGDITKNNIIVIRGQGESIGCPEMLRPTSALVGYFGKNTPPLITDGRFSGGSHGVLCAHIDDMYKPESIVGYIKNGDIININTCNNIINVDIDDNEITKRKEQIGEINKPYYKNGYLKTYCKYVGNIDKGFIVE